VILEGATYPHQENKQWLNSGERKNLHNNGGILGRKIKEKKYWMLKTELPTVTSNSTHYIYHTRYGSS